MQIAFWYVKNCILVCHMMINPRKTSLKLNWPGSPDFSHSGLKIANLDTRGTVLIHVPIKRARREHLYDPLGSTRGAEDVERCGLHVALNGRDLRGGSRVGHARVRLCATGPNGAINRDK